jgi:hypothetical protein
VIFTLILMGIGASAQGKWYKLFNEQDLQGWTAKGNATWEVKDGILTGEGGRGHLYAEPVMQNLEIVGEFKVTDLGGGANSGLYFRANWPSDNPDGFPRGYEAQICHILDAHTGWLWKPGKPTGKATALLSKDGEWLQLKVKAVGGHIQISVNNELVMSHHDDEYKSGKFAIQCHNTGMKVEMRSLKYRPL